MSKAKTIRQQKTARRRTLLKLKAMLPAITVALLVLTMAIPCFSYTVKGPGTMDSSSEWTLLSNTWQTSRTALFGTGGDYSELERGFSQACFYTVLISSVLALISAGLSIWSSVGALRYFRDPSCENRERAIYRTFFNRPLVLLYQLLLLPLIAFPRVIVWYYQDMMFYPTTLKLTFPEPLMIGAALWILWIVATVSMREWEREMRLDPFADPHREAEPEEKEEYTPRFASAEEERLYEMKEQSRAEQLERIRQMLSRNDEEEHKESEEE